MKLYGSRRSPYVRKVLIVAAELGLLEGITFVPELVHLASTNPAVMSVNPLNKIPSLVLEDGTAIFDSPVICEYLHTVSPGSALYPAEPGERITALRWQAVGDGIMDVMILRLVEFNKPVERQWPEVISASDEKLRRTMDVLEREVDALSASRIAIGHFSIAVALQYLDFRHPTLGWRSTHSGLSAWLAEIGARPSLRDIAFIDDSAARPAGTRPR